MEFICVACAKSREKGLSIEAECVCEECFEYATTEVGDLIKTGGQAEIWISSERFDDSLNKTEIPNELGKTVDVAPIYQDSRSVWLILCDDGRLFRFDAHNERPPHYLAYFHGALYLSPEGTHILDDGWVWHPVGIPIVWSFDDWLSKNAWESEDGATRKEICARDYYWDHGIAWLENQTVVIGGIGNDDSEITDGARVFDITSTGTAGPGWRSDLLWAKEVNAFAGPAGRFFSDGRWLYSSIEAGFSRWDPKSGARTGHIENFHPMPHHPGAGEFVQLVEGSLLVWSAR